MLVELRRRGYLVVEEPGLRIVNEERRTYGTALPWLDATAFLRRAIDMAIADRIEAAKLAGWVFFDRGLIDAASGLQFLTGAPCSSKWAQLTATTIGYFSPRLGPRFLQRIRTAGTA